MTGDTHTHTPHITVNFIKGQAGEHETHQGEGCCWHPSVRITRCGRTRQGEPAPTETAREELKILRWHLSHVRVLQHHSILEKTRQFPDR